MSGEVGVIVPPPEPDAPPVIHGTSMFPPIVTPQSGVALGVAVILPVACPVIDTVEDAVKDSQTAGILIFPSRVNPQPGGPVGVTDKFP